LEINKTVIVASRWFLFYLTYIDDARSNTNQILLSYFINIKFLDSQELSIVDIMFISSLIACN